jgi:glycosyltransferase involved in cell wall biosynthesis
VYQKGDVARSKLLFSTASKETCWIRDLGFKMPIVEVPLGTDIDLTGKIATHDASIKFLSFVGRIYPVKGLDLLLKAWAKLKTKISDWHLFLVGPDQAGYMGQLESLAKTLGLSVRHGEVADVASCDITFAGPLFGSDKTLALLKSRGLLLPSYTENFGGVVIDALSLGLPVLASKSTPWEILEEASCGWQFDLDADSLCEALLKFIDKTDDERREMGLRGRKLVEEQYTWDAVVKKMVEGYERVLVLSQDVLD